MNYNVQSFYNVSFIKFSVMVQLLKVYATLNRLFFYSTQN